MTLTAAAVLALATSCQSIVSPITIQQIAYRESGFDPAAVHLNRDGSRDLGLMQINERNIAFLSLQNPFDPCQSIRAAADLLASFSRYNTGSPTRGITNGYAMAVQAVRVGVAPAAADSPPCPKPDPDDDGWHTAPVPARCIADDSTAASNEDPTHDDER
jgi:type IV secretion system protein VirB1